MTSPWIESHPGVLGGKPCIRGTRISVEFLRELVAGGATREEILAAYPQVGAEALGAVMAFDEPRARAGTTAADPAAHALAAAPFDDEPLDSEDLADLEASERDRQEGRLVSHEDARRELLGRS
jgi:uncharacterized protein (DUF433 family)